MGSIPGSGRSLGGGHGNPLQYSCLENPMDREAWRAIVHGVAKSQTRLKQLSMHAFRILCIFVQYLYSYMYNKEGLCLCLIILLNPFRQMVQSSLFYRLHARSLQLCLTLYTLWTVAHQAPLSMRFSREEHWSGFSHPPPGDHPYPGIEPSSLISLTLTGGFFTTSAIWEAPY